MTDDQLRILWQKLGGRLQGDMAVMPEATMLPLLGMLLKPDGVTGYSEAQIALACGRAGFPHEALAVLMETLKTL